MTLILYEYNRSWVTSGLADLITVSTESRVLWTLHSLLPTPPPCARAYFHAGSRFMFQLAEDSHVLRGAAQGRHPVQALPAQCYCEDCGVLRLWPTWHHESLRVQNNVRTCDVLRNCRWLGRLYNFAQKTSLKNHLAKSRSKESPVCRTLYFLQKTSPSLRHNNCLNSNSCPTCVFMNFLNSV